jgi:hypothetical protein
MVKWVSRILIGFVRKLGTKKTFLSVVVIYGL